MPTMYLRKLTSSSIKISQCLNSSARKSAFGFLASQRARLREGKLQSWSTPPTSSPPCSICLCSTFTGVRDGRTVEDPIPDEAKTLEFEDHLILKYKGVKLPLNYVWLRDHCRTGDSINHVTKERMVDSVMIDPNIQPVNVTVKEGTLKIKWPDGHQSEYGLDWLLHNTYEGQKHVCGTMGPFLWDAATLSASPPPRVQYQDYLTNDRQLAKVLHTLLKYGLAFIEEAPATMEATLAAAVRISHVRETSFGRHWVITSDQRQGAGYTTEALPLHTDNTHFNEPAGLLVSHMLEEGDSGGTSVLVDGFHAAERLRQDDSGGFNNDTFILL
ncbi:trimethyllysine dioxygenase, mitochondrial-like [Branchiostoma floridae]|uniref:trimethyllysine dioxygenase n=1 Tax=Branchiostoma floridae TaxID=7739 RepID=A0A9J7MD76_BRAFL|nr:trimethyllysine dioxygenase, mitochondrial-like [Branchiostoma floridae]